MTKKLSETAMQSELAQSAFFKPPAESVPKPAPASTADPDEHLFSPAQHPQTGTIASTQPSPASQLPPEFYSSFPASVRTPIRRTITRYAFEFFQDQIERLRAYALEEKRRGEKGSMSEMVREAIDLYFATTRRTRR